MSTVLEFTEPVTRSEACAYLKNLFGIPVDIPIGVSLFSLFCAKAEDKEDHVIFLHPKDSIESICREKNLPEKANTFFALREEGKVSESKTLYANTVTELRLIFLQKRN